LGVESEFLLMDDFLVRVFERDEDGNLKHVPFNDLEALMMQKLVGEQSDVGEGQFDAFQADFKKELSKAIVQVVTKHGLIDMVNHMGHEEDSCSGE
jgi:hypothetical protein